MLSRPAGGIEPPLLTMSQSIMTICTGAIAWEPKSSVPLDRYQAEFLRRTPIRSKLRIWLDGNSATFAR